MDFMDLAIGFSEIVPASKLEATRILDLLEAIGHKTEGKGHTFLYLLI